MAKVIFDTDILVDFTRGKEYAASLLSGITDEDRCTTSINQMELLQGARNKIELKKLDQFIERGFEVLPLTNEGCQRALMLIRTHALPDGLRTGDALVAAIAIENEAALATGNTRHFRKISGLRILDSSPE